MVELKQGAGAEKAADMIYSRSQVAQTQSRSMLKH